MQDSEPHSSYARYVEGLATGRWLEPPYEIEPPCSAFVQQLQCKIVEAVQDMSCLALQRMCGARAVHLDRTGVQP